MSAPDDYQQGATVKIMFLHVPSAWLGMLGWGLMSVAALGTLVWRHPLADVAAKAAAPIGAAFTFCASSPDRYGAGPKWGTYWVWDARLTSELILFLLYLGVHRALAHGRRSGRAPRAPPRSCRWSAPSICRSSSSRSNGGIRCTSRPRCSASAARPSIRRILIPLMIMAGAVTLLFFTLHASRDAQRNIAPAVRTMRMIQASAAS